MLSLSSRGLSILITNNELGALGGTETYTYLLAKSLKERGWLVEVFSPQLGYAAERISLLKIRCFASFSGWERYDVIHAHHRRTLQLVKEVLSPDRIFYLAHGIGEEEIPATTELMDIRILGAVSWEVKKHLLRLVGPKEVKVIPNFVDPRRFFPQKPVQRLEQGYRVLILSNYPSWQTREILTFLKPLVASVSFLGRNSEKLAKSLGEEGFRVNCLGCDFWHVEKVINKHDLVISLGRGILEAIFCGRGAIVFGIHGGDGLVTPENIADIAACNFSGRHKGYSANSPAMRASLLPVFAGKLPDLMVATRIKALKEFSSDKVVGKLEKTYRQLGGGEYF